MSLAPGVGFEPTNSGPKQCMLSLFHHRKDAIGCQAKSLKYFLDHTSWRRRPKMKRELDPPKKSGESLRTRHKFCPGPSDPENSFKLQCEFPSFMTQ